MVGHVRDSLREIDTNSWLLDDHLVITRSQSPGSDDHLWKDSDGWRDYISDALLPPPVSSPLSDDSFPKLVYDVVDSNVGFDLGDVLLRVKKHHPFQSVTPEPTILQWLANRDLTFPIPRTLYDEEDDKRKYHFVTRVPGKSIDEAWRDLDDKQKQKCVTRTAEICIELARWTSDIFGGVDGRYLLEPWLDQFGDLDLNTGKLVQNCKEAQMDTTTFVFSHNDIGPTNVIVDVDHDCRIGLVDWELAGFVPFEWVRTKPATCYGMDFCWKDVAFDDPSLEEWRLRLADELGRLGVPEAVDAYRAWGRERRERKHGKVE